VFGPASSRSLSRTNSLTTRTVHCSPGWKLTFGVMIQEFGPPGATVALLCGPVAAQLMSNQPSATSTGSVKLTVMLASRGALEPLLRGSLLRTVGGSSTMGVVGVGEAVVLADGGRGVAQGRGVGGPLAAVSRPVADEVNDGRVCRGAAFERVAVADERDLAARAAHVDRAVDVSVGDGRAGRPARGELDQVIFARRDDAAEGLGLPRRAGGRGVLNGPAGKVVRDGVGVEQLDEVVLVGRAGVAAAAVDLADDHMVEPDRGRRRGGSGRRLRRRSGSWFRCWSRGRLWSRGNAVGREGKVV
jgi:hypothetical protein